MESGIQKEVSALDDHVILRPDMPPSAHLSSPDRASPEKARQTERKERGNTTRHRSFLSVFLFELGQIKRENLNLVLK